MIGLLPLPLYPNKETIPDLLIGSEVAGREYTKSILCFLPAQSVGLFVPETKIELTKQELAHFEQIEGGNYCSARVWGLNALPGVLKTGPFTAFHNSAGPWLHYLSYLRAQFSPRPFPITCLIHGFSYQHALFEIFARLLLTPTLACDSIICTSRVARDAFQNNLEQIREALHTRGLSRADGIRLDIIPLGVDVELFRPRDKQDVRRILGLPANKTILLYFGRIDPASKADLNPLFLAFRELATKYGESLFLVLAVNGPGQAINLAQQAVEKLGFANRVILRIQPSVTEGPLYYAAADVFVSLSETLQESFGITPLEAMSTGLPVVVSDWSGYRETVVHGETGFRVTTYWADCDQNTSLFAPLRPWHDDHLRLSQSVAVDTSELFQYLDALIGNPERRDALGQAARNHVVAHFSWERVMARCYALWQELAKIASSLPDEIPCHDSLERPQYFRNFGHFATKCVDYTDGLEITDIGRQACHRPENLFLHPEMHHALHFKVLAVTLNYLRFRRFFKSRATVQEVCDKIGARYRFTPQVTLAHVMWLLKYGLLRIVSA